MIPPDAVFSIGEQVRISDPQWVWDGKEGVVKDIWRAVPGGPIWYLVRVEYPGGRSIRYDFRGQQLTKAG